MCFSFTKSTVISPIWVISVHLLRLPRRLKTFLTHRFSMKLYVGLFWFCHFQTVEVLCPLTKTSYSACVAKKSPDLPRDRCFQQNRLTHVFRDPRPNGGKVPPMGAWCLTRRKTDSRPSHIFYGCYHLNRNIQIWLPAFKQPNTLATSLLQCN